jgi:pimeloyl-ACP methyl ester carboxylesterase
MRRRAVGVAIAALVAGAACAGAPGVRTEEAASIEVAPPSTAPSSTSSPSTTPPSPPSTTDDIPATSPTTPDTAPAAAWRSCPGTADLALSLDWECRWIDVPLDHADPDGSTVQTAVTRPVLAPGDDRRPLVLEPGGPGDPGTSFAWWFVDVLPPDLLTEFYPVGWDPRGIGLADPPIDCGSFAVTDLPTAAACVEGSGDLLAHVGAADAALDLEEVRMALGVEHLDYLGFSYGTALGAVYAMAHPDRVGRFVLDGAIAPDAGDPHGPLADHTPTYAADEVAAAIGRFHELCAATTQCAAGPDSAALAADLRTTIDELPTDHYDGEPEQLISFDIDQVLEGATYDPWSFGLLGDALRDAADGDASTLAAYINYLVSPSEGQAPIDDEAVNAAYFAIQCADFSDVPEVWGCEDMPPAADLPVIAPVDVAVPILVVGTTYDPATPGRHAGELAAALGDARTVTWDGIGHTAFPTGGGCLDATVVGYLVSAVLPAEGATCPFIDGATTDAETADMLFGYDESWVASSLDVMLEDEGEPAARAACESAVLAQASHRVVTQLFLGVDSDAARQARDDAAAAC